jgi:hypothetical protein
VLSTFVRRQDRGQPALVVVVGWALVVIAAALLQRGLVAFAAPEVLDWDETYYASIAATALAGYGLYPFVQGYPEMTAMGGIGHALWAYVGAFAAFGPDVRILRLVTFAAAALGLVGVWVLCRRWYGTTVAALTTAAVASSTLFRITVTARPDALVFAWGVWTLVAVAAAFARERPTRPHFVAGIAAALGLHVHLHSVALALAVGFAYLVDAGRTSSGVPLWRRPLAFWMLGYAGGAVTFVLASVAPDPEAFFRTAGLTRLAMLDDVSYAAEEVGGTGLLATFFSPASLLAKEIGRYRVLYSALSPLEVLAWFVGVTALWLPGGSQATRILRPLVVGVLVGGAMVLNGTSPLYATHLLPVLLLPVADVLMRLTSGRRGWTRALAAAVAFVTLAGVSVREAIRWPVTRTEVARLRGISLPDEVQATVDTVRARVSPGCHLAGDTSLYVPYFTDYPAFTGTRETEVRIGSSYARLRNDRVAYWRLKAPDVVFGPLDADLTLFVDAAGYTRIAERVWGSPAIRSGCELRAE